MELATGEILPVETLPLEGLDANFLHNLEWLEHFGGRSEMQEVALENGEAGNLITIHLSYDFAQKMAEMPLPVIAMATQD